MVMWPPDETASLHASAVVRAARRPTLCVGVRATRPRHCWASQQWHSTIAAGLGDPRRTMDLSPFPSLPERSLPSKI